MFSADQARRAIIFSATMLASSAIDRGIHSLAGKVVYRVKRKNLAAGEHSIGLCGVWPAAGIYLVAVDVDKCGFSAKCCLR